MSYSGWQPGRVMTPRIQKGESRVLTSFFSMTDEGLWMVRYALRDPSSGTVHVAWGSEDLWQGDVARLHDWSVRKLDEALPWVLV